MFLVQILLPSRDNAGAPFSHALYEQVRTELAARHGGATAYLRSPAAGLWRNPDGEVARDDVVMIEVVVDSLDRVWWGAYRRTLEKRFRQDDVLLRALAGERL